jgi:hypothetical protein
MANYMGGSAPAMAGQIGDGFILVSASTLKGYSAYELNLLRAELDKILRDTRALVPPQDDHQALAARNRKIARLSSAMQVLGAQLTLTKPAPPPRAR